MVKLILAPTEQLNLSVDEIALAETWYKLGLDFTLVTSRYDPNADLHLRQLGIPKEMCLNMYDYFQSANRTFHVPVNFSRLTEGASSVHNLSSSTLNLYRHGQNIAAVHPSKVEPTELGSVSYALNSEQKRINYIYDSRGFLSSVITCDEEGHPLQTTYYSPLGEALITRNDADSGQYVDLLTGQKYPDEMALFHEFLRRISSDDDVVVFDNQLRKFLEHSDTAFRVKKYKAVETSTSTKSSSRFSSKIWLSQTENLSVRIAENRILIELKAFRSDTNFQNKIISTLKSVSGETKIEVVLLADGENANYDGIVQLFTKEGIPCNLLVMDNMSVFNTVCQYSRLIIAKDGQLSAILLQESLSFRIPIVDVQASTEIDELKKQVSLLLSDLNKWNVLHERMKVDTKRWNKRVGEGWFKTFGIDLKA